MAKISGWVGVLVLVGLIGAASSGGLALAAPISFTVPLSGDQQVPPVMTTGSGTADLTYNPQTRVVTWSITYSGLSSPITGHATLTPPQARQFMAGQWYINVHTTMHPDGEIRGQVQPPKA